MVGLKTLVLPMLLCGFAAEAGDRAAAQDDLLHTFATCAGRLTAQMHHLWLLSDPEADRAEAQRAAMIDILDAAMPDGSGRDVFRHRSAGREAHAALLTRATFNEDQRDAAWAQRRVQSELALCRALLLP